MHRFCLAVLVLLPASVLLLPAADKDVPKPPRPTNLSVNTKADEDDPHVSSDGRRLYYSSNARGKFDILVSERASTAQGWPMGKLTDDLLKVRTKVDDRSVFVTPEGRYPQYIYFATKLDDDKAASFDIYVATKVLPGRDRVFTEVQAVEVIGSKADELHPWLTADGRNLYFSRKTDEGWRVMVATRKDTGPKNFNEPAPIKQFPPNFHHATLTPDGKTMYLQGPLDKGRWGLFVSSKTPKGWGEPVALDALNHPEARSGDQSPCLSRDGALLYFASDRPAGKGGLDLWVIPTKELGKK